MGKKTILITGANGLLGTECLRLFDTQHNVYAVVRNHSSCLSGATPVIMDLSQALQSDILPEQVDVIIHLAQSQHFREFPDKAADIFNVNIGSTAQLLDYAVSVKAKQFIYVSSGGVYGSGNDAFHENQDINARGDLGYYLSSKLCAELLVQNYTSFLDAVIIRPFFMYGEAQKKSMLIPRLVEQIKAGKPVYLQGEDGIHINPIHVADAAKVIKGVLEHKGSYILNLAGPQTLSLREIAQVIGDVVGKKPIFEHIEQTSNSLVGDISLLEEMSLTPSISFEQGVRDLI